MCLHHTSKGPEFSHGSCSQTAISVVPELMDQTVVLISRSKFYFAYYARAGHYIFRMVLFRCPLACFTARMFTFALHFATSVDVLGRTSSSCGTRGSGCLPWLTDVFFSKDDIPGAL